MFMWIFSLPLLHLRSSQQLAFIYLNIFFQPPLTAPSILQVVVFFSTCDAVDFHYSLLSEFQWSAMLQKESETKQLFLKCKTLRLHGSMNHEDRKTTFQMFKTDKSALLLSTDVSARGLDIPKVKCIIQYDSPGEATEYVHRYYFFRLLYFLSCLYTHKYCCSKILF